MTLNATIPPKGTVRDWLDHRVAQGGVAMVFPDTGEALDWTELQHEAKVFARLLTARGGQKADSIAIVSPNSRAGVVALYGALIGGFRATMINLAAGRDAIAYALEHSEAKLAYVHDTCRPLFDTANDSGVVPIGLVDDDTAVDDVPLHDVAAGDHALLMYTSGTTGRPKGVVHTHASLLAGGWTTAIAHQLGVQDRGFCILP
ncbi:MAG: AMP-binding protein, partial [Paracoccaceae bacterium]